MGEFNKLIIIFLLHLKNNIFKNLLGVDLSILCQTN
jgi:hypothetical protein